MRVVSYIDGRPDGDDAFAFRAPDPGTVHVGGSFGYFSVDKATGSILIAVYYDPPGTPPRDEQGKSTGYRDIARFDPAWFADGDTYDIVDTVFVTDLDERVGPLRATPNVY